MRNARQIAAFGIRRGPRHIARPGHRTINSGIAVAIVGPILDADGG